ncbi:bifunctional ADP-dependent NAD(P)H-hydrate dehydratase/NAD(P)H-hydrate epimerase [Erwinia psidii]|uniref:Bifunctional NAD(P)H-hydrate repair enzyme n=1 Tax=Erwinia psidii TaxID=69224 RepID=A0A3N6TRX2_9GAMM|nr:bifunctional ADP-dependent NAD(P)H-hydrate dehydratase/NAD(P)H-hydrate epimerase [Erwinia psidii]MCX8958281.1 bifunctional ADP-dependent NAD(P)H-hydrate dehydratase/NAD(P)H-hydrate epimerase [Erwinia psidii]MCX8962422.1 bifunctional ADP-dependent NAD(P)H-hydrate dehydratase/NAD(P)H-hydrate epimerase [Erwinia psidii]MCX8965207.1 bifunctional ADP-dependent NAD(P)H-hydrate dehydratase/NAD(P)H-hydrate epimerase [Erwinia psidii]RQM37992.1 bifunctional ADP-dependent NAD(P)H-hydrate dehydratase/NAD
MNNLSQQNDSSDLPYSVWPAEGIAQLERDAADAFGITLYELMKRAGEAVFRQIQSLWPDKRHWLILCGHGNNGGDGFVVARLAQAAGITVTVIACEGRRSLPEEAQHAYDAWLAAGGVIHHPAISWPENVEVIVDALLGTGLKNAPEETCQTLIARANAHPATIFAVDIPSGLVAADGTAPGKVIVADHTLTFVALKPGLLTGKARDYVGKLHYDGLNLHCWLSEQTAPFARYDTTYLTHWFHPRRPTSHKGDHGKLVIIGGDHGTAGAVRLAGEAALRAGAGLVRVLTHKHNITPLLTARPELMVDELSMRTLDDALAWADVIVIGPGLGQEDWGKNALKKVENSQKPMLWDADALNLLAISPDKRQNRIITPHPGEAARLLNISTDEVESDRLHSARCLVKRYGGVVVLKGAGTLIASEAGQLAFADVGNAGMATGGMGDLLSGIIGSLLGQKLSLYDAACAGSVVHGAAAEEASKRTGQRGMLASDLFSELHLFVNPEIPNRK